MYSRIILLLAFGSLIECAVIASNVHAQPCPVVYGNTYVLRTTTKNEVYVVKAIADPVFYYSRAYIVAWKFASIKDLERSWHSQEAVGNSNPGEIDRKGISLLTVNSGHKSPTEVDLEIFDLKASWFGGNEKSGWVRFQDVNHLEIAEIEKLPVKLRLFDHDFEPLVSFIKKETDNDEKHQAIRRR